MTLNDLECLIHLKVRLVDAQLSTTSTKRGLPAAG